jgi:hypothetical protein
MDTVLNDMTLTETVKAAIKDAAQNLTGPRKRSIWFTKLIDIRIA